MRAVVTRVKSASVTIAGETVGRIGKGFLVLLGVSTDDAEAQAVKVADRICGLRVFEDEAGKMNVNPADAGAELLIVSQFTLYADCKKGNRPSFIAAGKPPVSEPLYEAFVHELIALGVEKVATGRFGADMQVYIQNDGPVTIVLDTDEISPKRVAVRKLEKEGR